MLIKTYKKDNKYYLRFLFKTISITGKEYTMVNNVLKRLHAKNYYIKHPYRGDLIFALDEFGEFHQINKK